MNEIYMMLKEEWQNQKEGDVITLYKIALDTILQAERDGYILATPYYDYEEYEDN